MSRRSRIMENAVDLKTRVCATLENHAGTLRRLLLLMIVIIFCLNIYPSLLTSFDYSILEQRYRNWMADPGNFNLLLGTMTSTPTREGDM